MPKQFSYPGILRFLFQEKAILIAALVFCTVCTAIGMLLPRDIQALFMEPLMAKFEGMGFNAPEIFVNNLRGSGVIVLGGFILAIASFAMTGLNFLVLGCAMNYFAPERTSGDMLIMLLPHGIIELPAIVLSLVAGIYIARAVVFKLKNGGGFPERVSEYLLQAAALFILVVIPMLIAASLIEVYISPVIAGLVTGGGD
ncbi:MAG: hypothetical protein A2Y33_15650 [Spirochaetes bacterium GWF1_51_8]|nr:MAG: hypothetical protein A2Y33_15650 [Spirochaetes bacterium GWF1_51_8]